MALGLLRYSLLPTHAYLVSNVPRLVAFLPELSLAMLALEGALAQMDSNVVLDVAQLGVLDSAFRALQQLVFPASLFVQDLALQNH